MSDASFGRWFSIMLIAMIAVTFLLAIVAAVVSGDLQAKLNKEKEVENSPVIAERLTPVGNLSVGDVVPPQVMVEIAMTGDQVYSAACTACHTTGVSGAPIYGDSAGWQSRLGKGEELLISNAINGFTGESGFMPPRGGLATLTDEEVIAAVQYMLEGI